MLDKKRIEVLANIVSYKPSYVIRRVLLLSLWSVILFNIAILFTEDSYTSSASDIWGYLLLVIAFNCVSEVNILLIRNLRRINALRNRVVIQTFIIIIITVLFVWFWLGVAEFLFGESQLLSNTTIQVFLMFGFFLLVNMTIIVLMSKIINEWMESRKEVERLKNAKLISDYSSLQDRLNPHFLFNNLSVLKSLIRYNPDAAENFTQNFTDVYRYLLKSHESQTVSVSSELKFVEAYIALHKERLGEGLIVTTQVEDEVLTRAVPPMSVQLLVENAIKHNIANRSHPLHIYIVSDNDKLTVKNKINKKSTTYSTHTGLKTLQAQYELISDQRVEIKEENDFYVVSVPLL